MKKLDVKRPCVTCNTPTDMEDLSISGNCPACQRVINDKKRKLVAKNNKLLAPKPDLAEAAQTEDLKAMDSARLKAEQAERFEVLEEAKKEAAARELARRRLLPFIKRNLPGYEPGWIHADICQKLEKFSQDVVDRKSPRLMLFVPPRHGKSEIASKNFPAWHMGRNPTHEIIQASYASDLALDFSRKVRDQIKSAVYRALFETKLDRNSQALERWNTTAGGAYAAVGVRGPITGRGAHIGIIDDPVKDRQDAESPALRQQIKDWYSSTFYTRLAPGGGVLIIMTRWHEDDLAGWLVSLMEEAEKEARMTGEWPEDADRWEIIRYPAIAEEDEKFRKKGEALHEARYPLPALRKIKRTLINRDWIALYQQRPVAEDGDFFKRSTFKFYNRVDRPPLDSLNIYAAWDQALGKKDVNDWTVCAVVGIDRDNNIWLLNLMRGKWSSLEIIDKMIDVQETWMPVLQGVEQSMIEMSIEPMLLKVQQERGVFIPYEKLKHRGLDKVARAQAIRTRIEQGKVYFPNESDASWVSTLVEEMAKFPGGIHDDQVDALSWIGQMVMMFSPLHARAEDTTPKWMKRLRSGMRSKRSNSAMGA